MREPVCGPLREALAAKEDKTVKHPKKLLLTFGSLAVIQDVVLEVRHE